MLDLMRPLLYVSLVNAQRVDPKHTGSIIKSTTSQPLIEAFGNAEIESIN
jgi:hypothetical protein